MSMDPASSLLRDMNDYQADESCPPGPADNKVERPQEKKTVGSKRRKTFTGCWTCRERHVKCDEQRPRCKRCVAGNFTCQGYSTRLTWLTPGRQKTSNDRVRTRPAVEPRASESIDIQGGRSFSAHPISEPRSSRKRRRFTDQRSRAAHMTNQAHQVAPSVDMIEPSQGILTTRDPALLGGFTNDTGFSTYQSQTAGMEHVNQKISLWQIMDSSGSSSGLEHFQPDLSGQFQQEPVSGMKILNMFDGLSIPRISSPMKPFVVPTIPARERELISHWSTNLADKLVPFRTPMNPFLTVVCPMVLEGSRIARTKSTCTVALFHAVCAISAAHQTNLRACSSDDGLIEHHKQLSFQHLMQNMDHTDHDERMACLATLCLWILIHFVTGTPGAWRDVTKVTRDLLERISPETWGQSTTASLTYQSFSTSFTLIQAQYLGRRESLAPLKPSLPGVDTGEGQIIPLRSRDLLSSFNAKLMRTPALAPEELDQMEIEFALSTPEPSTDFDAGNKASSLLHHHQSLFYYASMLYFKGNSGRRGPEDEVQSLVCKCLDQMENIEQLQKDANPKTWIYAAVAFEAGTPELRDRAKRLVSRRKSSGIATWDTLLRAVEEIWRRRDATPPEFLPEPWTRMLAEMPEFDVVLY